MTDKKIFEIVVYSSELGIKSEIRGALTRGGADEIAVARILAATLDKILASAIKGIGNEVVEDRSTNIKSFNAEELR